MTEETTQETTTEAPANNGVNISVEQILASILQTVGDVNVKIENLIANYGSKSIAVNQQEDKSVTFSLVDASEAEKAAQAAQVAQDNDAE
jgi:hypothetical protein